MTLRRSSRLHHRQRHVDGTAVEHVGVLVPWANTVVEAELPIWANAQVVWHHARLAPPGGGTALTDDFLAGLIQAMPGALHQLSALPLQRVYLACTSAAFTRQRAAKEAAAASSAQVVTAFDAIIATLHESRLSSIALATPYPGPVTAVEVEAFEAAGIAVTAATCLDLADGYADITTDRIADLVLGIKPRDLARADAVVLSCTGWPTRTALARLRHKVGRPVLSSNLAICLHALRKSL